MKRTTHTPTERDREERARRHKLLSVNEPPAAGDFFRLKGGTYEVVRYIAATQQVVYRNINNPEAEPLRDTLDALMTPGAYYVEAPHGFKRRAERARAHGRVSAEDLPEAGDYFVVNDEAWRVQVVTPHGNFDCVTARGERRAGSFDPDYLVAEGAYFVTEQEARTVQFKIDVTVHRADPEATTENFRLIVPGVLEATWSGKKEIVLDVLGYVFREHGAALLEGMNADELRLFSEKLLACADELKQHPELERAAVSLTGTREVEARP